MRLFFAVEIPKLVKDEVKALMQKYSMIKFTLPENLHFTLKFLGEVEDVKGVIKKVEGFGFKPFIVRLKGVGCFPNKSNIRVLWLGVDKGEEDLSKLAFLIDEKTKHIRFNDYKGFVPHLTIARFRSSCPKKILYEFFESSEFKVDKFLLMSSNLTREGPVYNIVKEFSLI